MTANLKGKHKGGNTASKTFQAATSVTAPLIWSYWSLSTQTPKPDLNNATTSADHWLNSPEPATLRRLQRKPFVCRFLRWYKPEHNTKEAVSISCTSKENDSFIFTINASTLDLISSTSSKNCKNLTFLKATCCFHWYFTRNRDNLD